jgi:methylenetetrahydrofolate reductase (NADPH)
MTHELVERVKTETKLDPMAHLTSTGHTQAEIESILTRYAKAGVSNILALRGDPPKGNAEASGTRHQASEKAEALGTRHLALGEGQRHGDFAYAVDLVKFIKGFTERNRGVHPDARGFGIAVAGYPEGHPGTPNRLVEMDHLKAKVDAGADAIVTQLFFDNRDFLDFRDRCRLSGIKVPIVAGIMPITSMSGLKRILELAAGARAPAALLRALGRAESGSEATRAEAVRRVGVHWATEQCRDLLDHGVEGIHLYTLNKSTATREIYATLGVEDSLGMTR